MSYASKARDTSTQTITGRYPDTRPALQNIAVPTDRVWSKQQNKIFDWFEDGDGHLVVVARAGTGKTTTIIEAVKRAPEKNILLAAFNKRIKEELESRIGGNPNIEAKTLHAIGFSLVREYWRGVKVAKGNDREYDLSRKGCIIAHGGTRGRNVPDTIIKLINKLHTKGREINPLAEEPEDLRGLMEQFECEPEPFWFFQGYDDKYVAEAAFAAMEFAKDEQDKPSTGIDFADMIYLPIVKGWAMGKYDLGVVDEMQDMTTAQLILFRLVLTPYARICGVGDDRQGIYGFRGADSGSLQRLKKELDAEQLMLTVTYRCGQSIVRRAQEIVPDIEAHKSNPEGTIEATDDEKLIGLAQPGDFILSRLNAPLAGVCMKLLRSGKRAEIAGRDIAGTLKALVRKLAKGSTTISEFHDSVLAWEKKEVDRLTKLRFETRVQLVQDQTETLMALSEDAQSVQEVENIIERIFTDDGPNAARILCSSVHKAKGLEADRVFLLDWTFRDGGKFGGQEESNIRYVAVTRAKSTLVYVDSTR